MHDNVRTSKAVKDSKSIVFLIPTVNRRDYSSLRGDCLYLHKENFKTLLVVFTNTVVLILDVKLLVCGKKRQTPKTSDHLKTNLIKFTFENGLVAIFEGYSCTLLELHLK